MSSTQRAGPLLMERLRYIGNERLADRITFEEQPLRLPPIGVHQDQRILAGEFRALQSETDRLCRDFVERIFAPIPNLDLSSAVLPFWDRPLEGSVVDGVVFYLHGEPFDSGEDGWPLWHRPGLEHTVHFEPEIEVMVRSPMLVNDESGHVMMTRRPRLYDFTLA